MRSFAACHVADQKSIIHTIALVHCLVLFHGMTALILEIYCVAFREQRLHVHLAPAKIWRQVTLEKCMCRIPQKVGKTPKMALIGPQCAIFPFRGPTLGESDPKTHTIFKGHFQNSSQEAVKNWGENAQRTNGTNVTHVQRNPSGEEQHR